MKIINSNSSNSPFHNTHVYLWRERTLFIVPPYQSRARLYHADSLLIGFEGPLRIQIKGQKEVIESSLVMLKAGTEFYMEVEGENLGLMFLDYLSTDYKKIQTKASQHLPSVYYDFDKEFEENLRSSISHIYCYSPDINEVEDTLFDLLEIEPSAALNTDSRLRKIINLYLNGELHLNAPVAEAAAAVNLSVPRVVQLFKKHIGINFRTFRNRQRIHMVLLASAFGKSLSNAALEAGFVDQAHFCKRFKESTGVNALTYMSKSIQSNYFIEDDIAKRYLNDESVYGSVLAR